MDQNREITKQKIHLFAWALIICNALFCFCDSPTMGIRFYLPIFIPALCLGLFALFTEKIKFGFEHLTCAVFLLIIVTHLNNSLEGFREKNAALFSFTALMLFFFVFSSFKYNLRELKYIINSLIIAGTGFSILLFLFSFHLGQGHYTIKPFNGYYQYIDPNYLSSFMVIPCIILMKRAIYTHRNILTYMLFITNVLAVLLTGSRAAMLSVFIALIILLIVKKNIKALFTVIVVVISVTVCALLFLDRNIIERLFINSYVDDSNTFRLVYWISHIMYTLENNPFMGTGLSTIQDSYWLNISSHSTFISFFASFGLIGFSFFATLLFKIAKQLFFKDTLLYFALFISFLFVNQMIPASLSYSFWGILLIFVIIIHFKKNNPDISIWKEL